MTILITASLPACASTMATVTYTAQQLDPTTWRYNLTLNDTGTTNIGTLWFAWIPGQDYMPTAPMNILSPANWTSSFFGGGGSDGYSVRWVAAGGAALTAGQSLSGFQFDSNTTPQQLAGLSNFFSHPPVTTTFVYEGGPFTGGSSQLVAAAGTPEPSTIFLSLLGGIGLALRQRRCR